MEDEQPTSVGGVDVRLRERGMHDLVTSAASPGERLRIARVNAGLTMGQIARLTGDTVAQISAEETGEAGLTQRRIKFLTSYYGASLAWVEGGTLNVIDADTRRKLAVLAPDDARNALAMLGTLSLYEVSP